MQCSPYNHDTFYKNHNTCFSKKQLTDMASSLGLKVSESMKKKTLWSRINERMQEKYGCTHGDEHCWVDSHPKSPSHSHVPAHPTEWLKNPYSWLSNLDIMNVMVQYENKYPSFKFVGVFPIDFASKDMFGKCLYQEMCSMNVEKIKRKYKSLGFVFNLDRHDQPGSHWVSMYMNFDKNQPNYGVYYFDSNALPAPIELREFANSILKQVNDKDFEFHENTIRKQFHNSECGMFCLNFLIQCIKKKPFKKLLHEDFTDQHAHRLRKVLFRKPKSVTTK